MIEKSRRPLLLTAVTCLVAFFGLSSAALANWGPSNECGIKSEPVNEHCYAIAERSTHKLASIAAENARSMEVHDWASGAFVDMEEWISFSGYNGWVETGQTAGNGSDCCTLHPFYAELGPHETYHEYVSPEGIQGGYKVYNYFLLFDSLHNGGWNVEWGCNPWGKYDLPWCRAGEYTGWPEYFVEQESGVEDATTIEPNEWGKDEVAASEGGSWEAWTGAKWYKRGPLVLESNPENTAPGDIQWAG